MVTDTENARETTYISKTEAPITWKAYVVCVSAAFGGVFFGYDIGWMSGVLGTPIVIQQYTGMEHDFNAGAPVDSSRPLTIPSSDTSLLTSMLSLGTFIGSLIPGDLADLWGRCITILMGCAIFACGVIVEIASSDQIGVITVGCLVAGLCVGFESAVIILYMSEASPKMRRGTLLSAYHTIGMLLANCVVYASQDTNDTDSYRIPIGVQFLWACVLATALFLLPESPRYFVKKRRHDHAATSLSFIREQPIASGYIQNDLAEIVSNHQYETTVNPEKGRFSSWAICFKGPISKPSSLTTTLVNVVCTALAFWTIERFGRRPLLIYGGLCMFLMKYIIGAVRTAQPENETAIKGVIAVTSFQILFYSTTCGPAAWVVVGETFSLPIRSRGNRVLAVIAPYMTGNEKEAVSLGTKAFFFWGGLSLLGALFACFLMNRMLEENSLRKSARWIPKARFAQENSVDDKPQIIHHKGDGGRGV
ncbi:putative sugar transporter [Aspergillus steynii IBT 23096]|uniref:Putative sugar transporter n=1 Tax=Aspergillus steynii IBT 23096 TaxID=1392250 RepID=A0A2I2G908_9EURO|nr:putative sugar transporter [Aspergillus steynii IBT 23096]PLB49338.1 putative sugar transporter [Aspergillus steynii IBT 23096]